VKPHPALSRSIVYAMQRSVKNQIQDHQHDHRHTKQPTQ
jgi:hypothetical protein